MFNKVLKSKWEKKSFHTFALHPVSHVTIRVICFEHTATWKRCDMRQVSGNIFEDRKI